MNTNPRAALHFTPCLTTRHHVYSHFTRAGKIGAWRFDKRSYSGLPPPRNLQEPPPGMANELVRHLIHSINEASAAIPGWDEYAKTGKAKELWDGVV
jgi:hydroxyproline O-arabinosyltransferase